MKTEIDCRADIVCIYSIEYTDDTEAEEIISYLEQLLESSRKKYSILVNVQDFKGSSSKARAKIANFLRHYDEKIKKIAITHKNNPTYQFAVKTILTLSGFRKAEIFKTEKEALEWLQTESVGKSI